VTVRAGSQTIDLPVDVHGNTRFSGGTRHDVFVKAVRNAMVGSHEGGLTVKDDDPMPTISVTPVADRVTEGGSMTWRLTMSAVADTDVWLDFKVLPVSGGTELSSRDVDPEWFTEHAWGESPDPARPLSQVEELSFSVGLLAGQLSTEVTVPTVADGVSEPEELMRIQQFSWADGLDEPVAGPVFTGTVLDAR
jgi:hypothetical protein